MRKSQKQRNTFFAACLLCLAVPLVLGFFSYNRASNLLRRYAEDSSRAVLLNARDALDAKYNEINLLFMQIYADVRDSQLAYATNPSTGASQMKKIKLIASIYDTCGSVDYISDYFIYLPTIKTVITPSASYASLPLYYNNNLSGLEAEFEAWNATINRRYEIPTVDTNTYSFRAALKNTLVIYHSFPMLAGSTPRAQIALFVSKDKLSQPLGALLHGSDIMAAPTTTTISRIIAW